MNIQYTGHHMEVTQALKDHIAQKMQRLERHLDDVIDAQVILSTQRARKHAEGKLQINGATLFADAETDDMYAAIDAMLNKLDRQVRKHKDKQNDHHP